MSRQASLTSFFGGGGGGGKNKGGKKGDGKIQSKLPTIKQKQSSKSSNNNKRVVAPPQAAAAATAGGAAADDVEKENRDNKVKEEEKKEKKAVVTKAIDEGKEEEEEGKATKNHTNDDDDDAGDDDDDGKNESKGAKSEKKKQTEPKNAAKSAGRSKPKPRISEKKTTKKEIGDDEGDDLMDTSDEEDEVEGGGVGEEDKVTTSSLRGRSKRNNVSMGQKGKKAEALSRIRNKRKDRSEADDDKAAMAGGGSKRSKRTSQLDDEEEEKEVDDEDMEEVEEEEEYEPEQSDDGDNDEEDEHVDDDDVEEEEDNVVPAAKKSTRKGKMLFSTGGTTNSSNSTKKRTKKAAAQTDTKSNKSSTAASDVSKKMISDVLKHPPKSSTTTSSSSNNIKKKSELAATTIKSNTDLLSSSNASWKDKSNVPYLALCTTFQNIESISGRLDIQTMLTNLFRLTLLKNSKDMYDLIYLASNTVAPAYDCIELGVGDSILIKAIGEASGTNPAMVKQKYESVGDLGNVAQMVKGKQRTLGFGAKPKPLLAKEVLAVFRQIATTSGAQSQKWKVDKIKGLLVRAQGPESKYIIRGLQGKLRIGLAQSTVLVSLAHSLILTPPVEVEEEGKKVVEVQDDYPEAAIKLSQPNLALDVKLDCAASIIKKAYSEVPSYDSLLNAALTVPLQEMHIKCTLTPGVPVSPMLAKPTKSIQEVLKRLNGLRFTCEYKYDGERAQVHMSPDGVTKVFSRSLLDTSEKFPEVPLYVKEACSTAASQPSFVLDTEVVAFNRETNQFVPFQILSTRKKTEESAESAKVQVIVQAFDLMYWDGKSLLNKTLFERRELLRKHFMPVERKFQFATSLDHTEDGDTAVLEEFLDTAVKNQCEGLMVKTLDVNAVYEPSRRSLNWLKLKKDYLEGLGDSVDLVPLGAYHGRGKRTGLYGAYLLACYDVDTEEYQSVCKIGTGFSEEDLKTLAEGLNEHVIPTKTSQYNVSDTLDCDVWFDAVQVWEVKAADLSKSSTHKGAIDKTGEAGRGIGLRFPRFERVRPDKRPEEATTSDQILDLYYAQDSVVDDGIGAGGGGGYDEEMDGI